MSRSGYKRARQTFAMKQQVQLWRVHGFTSAQPILLGAWCGSSGSLFRRKWSCVWRPLSAKDADPSAPRRILFLGAVPLKSQAEPSTVPFGQHTKRLRIYGDSEAAEGARRALELHRQLYSLPAAWPHNGRPDFQEWLSVLATPCG